MKTLQTIWNEIETKRKKSSEYGSDFPMNPPTSNDILEQRLARVLGFPVPAQLQESLLIHDGMDHEKGVWRNTFIPLSVEAIIKFWWLDRRTELEARNEGDDVTKFSHQIPIMMDSVAHHEIYMDSRDGSILNYEVDGLRFLSFQYRSYLDFLTALHEFESQNGYFEWPR